jgi:hypothetical protein
MRRFIFTSAFAQAWACGDAGTALESERAAEPVQTGEQTPDAAVTVEAGTTSDASVGGCGSDLDCVDDYACTLDRCLPDGECTHTAPDQDRDGRGDAECKDRHGASLGNDCDDQDAQRFPGNPEFCTLDAPDHDEDCDPTTFGVLDADQDGHTHAACCNGHVCGDDCNDQDGKMRPGASDVCNGLDDDCDAAIDEHLPLATWYADTDLDGYGKDDTAFESCKAVMEPGYATRGGDCDDGLSWVRPNSLEGPDCNGVDDDCSGVVDDGLPCQTLAL